MRAFEADMCTFLRAKSSLIWYKFWFATTYLSRYMFILNSDFDVLPTIFDKKFMLCSLAKSMKYVTFLILTSLTMILWILD